MNYIAKIMGDELKRELSSGCDIVRIARMAFRIYHEHGLELSEKLDEIVLTLMAMEEGPEFELSECELRDLIKFLEKM